MKSKWIEASDEFQIPFMRAAQKVFQGERLSCPKCHSATLRYYFHMINASRGQGTLWAWCPHCFTKCHLPRVSPPNMTQIDPFANLTLEAFAELELDSNEPLISRLNRLWEDGKLS